MKKLLVYLGIAAILGTAFKIGYATCANSDFVCYESGPSQNITQKFRVDSSGNVTSAGTMAVSGAVTNTGAVTNSSNVTTAGTTIFTRTQAIGISSITTISPTSTYIIVASTGVGTTVPCGNSSFGALGSTAAAPCISTTTAVDGQYLIISATQTNATVTFSSATTSGMDLGSATRVVGYNKVLTLIFDGVSSVWKEVSFGNN